MKKNNNERKMFYAADCILIAGLMVYTLLDTFVITRTYQTVDAHVVSDTSAVAEGEGGGEVSQRPAEGRQGDDGRRHSRYDSEHGRRLRPD